MKKGLRAALENFGALILASLLFAASHPNILFSNGLPLIAWFAFIPVFWVINRSSLPASALYGAFYGYVSYNLFNYWLSVFHPLAGLIVSSIYLVYFTILFPLMVLAFRLFPKKYYIVQFLLFIAYEYLKTQGFLGYSYGITGYTQWRMIPIIQIADIAGVWAVSALVVFPSSWLAAFLHENGFPGKPALFKKYLKNIPQSFIVFFKRERIAALVWITFLLFTIVYGFASQVNYSNSRTVRIAMIQHNTDPWAPSHAPSYAQAMDEYRNDFNVLRRLSDEALAAHPDTDLVVWSETAFVPRIHWHTTFRNDLLSLILVRDLLNYLGSQEVPFLLGNDDARSDPELNPNPEYNHIVDYNAVMLYYRGELTGLYRKLHLVPFTEHFPYQRQLPWVYQALRDADTHFWFKGSEATVFESGNLRFSTPICFEDTFGYLTRDFVRNGAEIIINLSNDAWSNSLPAQMQHLSMAVFRAVENRRSMARSTASGMTCAVDPNGAVFAMAEPFTEAWLSAEIPVYTSRNSLYTRYGDYLGLLFLFLAILMLIIGAIKYIMGKSSPR